MFNSRKTKLSNADNATGQSLFDFLKRKKRVSLEESIRGSRREQTDLSISNIHVKEEQPGQTTRNQTYRKIASTNITPKKVTFVQSEEKKQTARTFIDMISPLKPKQKNYQIDQTQDNAQVSQRKGIYRSSNKKSQSEQFSRKQLNSSIAVLKQTLQQLIKVGKTLKQKSHSLFIDMKPVFKVCEENTSDNKIIRKKIEDAQQKLRVMEHQFNLLDIENANEIIESFHKTLAEHLVSVEAKNKANFQKNQMDTFVKLKTEKDSKITELVAENRNLSHSCSVLQKKIQKLELLLAQTKQKEQEKFQNYHCSNESKFARLEAKIKQLQEKNQALQQTSTEHEKQKIEWTKKVKDALYGKQIAERKLVEEHDKAKSAREQFLLNEIMLLKQEFQCDMSQLTSLYSAKEQENQLTIGQQAKQIKELKSVIQETREREKRTSTDSQSLKSVAGKYKKQNECLVTDMHRMNEELYQHWLALKDIKTLASRLQIMPKFSRIFDDLAFNDLLFS